LAAIIYGPSILCRFRNDARMPITTQYRTVANIFALFLSEPIQIHGLPDDVDSEKVLCLCTIHARATHRRTHRRKSYLNSGTYTK